MAPEHNKPPRWAQTLLRKFASIDSLEEVEGDLLEFFMQWKEAYGIRKARQRYVWTVFTLLRPFGKRKRHDHSSKTATYFMLRSYFKMSWRTLLKNKVSSLINISGLTLGLTTSILILLVVLNEFKYDQFHNNLPDIHLLMKNLKTNEGISTGWSTAGPMAEALRTEFPEVKYAARVAPFDEQQIVVNNKISYESGIYADPDLFKIMTFPSLTGDVISVLESNSAIAITKDMAKKLFADENPIGKTIVFNRHHSLTVGAVIENIPDHSTLKFGMVIPFALFENENDWLKKWDDNRIMTWMQLQPSADVPSFNHKITELLQTRSNDKMVSQFAYPLERLYLYGSFSNGHPDGGRITAVRMLIGFGVFMLLVACINFMNMATAQSEHRAREVGVRKVLGASRRWIVYQFLNESFMMTFLSLFTALALTTLIIPSFNTLTHSNIHFDLTSLPIWLWTLGIGVVTALLAGSYPSLFLSRFVPTRVLKGRMVSGKGGGLRRTLVTFQFVISVFFLIGTIIMYAQFEHVRNRPIGYEQANLIDIPLDSALSAKFAYLKTEALKIPNVRSATGVSGNILYSGGAVTGMDWPGKRPGEELSIVVADVEYDWSKTIGVSMVQGRDFDPAYAGDLSRCILNETAVAQMGLQNPVGAVVGGHEVIGVFRNYVFNNPFGKIAPMALYLNPSRVNHLYLRVQNDPLWRQTVDRIEKIAKSVSPEFPFHFSFTKDEYQHRFNEISDTSLMISIFGGMTIFISCLGLFGLSGFVAETRSKEMSIRKVFGASMLRVFVSLSQDFLRPVLIALLMVIPASFFIAQWALSNVSYAVPLSWWMFASGGAMILVISVTIVLYHGWKTAQESPAVRLKNE
jgi:ABC-type antimicrobial peptide transport system permease subunit